MTEQHAEDLYGPAPTGDEDPHASQAVPDPGETSGPITFEAQYLSGAHLGSKVRIHEVRDGYKFGAMGLLTAIYHGASIINEGSFASPERTTLGRRWVQVDFDAHSGTRVSPEATVELLG